MRLTGCPLLVVSSLICAVSAGAATRPHYGGTLHVETRAALTSLDPADFNPSDEIGRRNLFALMFDTLVSLNEQGNAEPALANSWQVEPGNQRWQFHLRQGVTFQDGTLVTADAVAASLRKTNPTWKVFSEGEAVVIERDSPSPNLPAELDLPRNSVVKRVGGKLSGSGPFAISQWDPGKKLVLTARDDYWDDRAFVDTIEIDIGRNLREQLLSLDLGRAQVIDIAPEQARREIAEGRRIESSAPVELIALVFDRDPQSADDARQRKAFALGIDRESLNTVVLQGGGEPAGGILPNWMTGYEFVFPSSLDLAQARQMRSEIPHTTAWSLSYDPADPVTRVIAERIALNARDAGLGIQITSTSAADVRLVRVPLVSLDGQIALGKVALGLGLPQPSLASSSVDDLYGAESKLLQSQRVIPLLHLRTAYGVSDTVRNWKTGRDGSWRVPNAWLAERQ